MISLSVDSAGMYKPTTNVGINPVSKKQPINESTQLLDNKQDQSTSISQSNNDKSASIKDDKQSEAIKNQIDEYKRIDQLVRAHEQAHMAAGGGLVRGGASYSYQVGPDGKRYIVGGEVQIDASPVPNNPEATIAKMQQVRRAALAPAEPSAQDRAVATQAAATESSARIEFTKRQADSYLEAKDNPPKLVDTYT